MEQYFYEAFNGLTRLAPGSELSTKKAASFIPKHQDQTMKILDVGCGKGAHTLELATLFPHAHITAIDQHQPFLDELTTSATNYDLAHRISAINMSMFEMDFAAESFDLIWAEGSIYIAGFQSGLDQWKKLLKTGGYLVCSEISWLHDNPSPEIKAFFEADYPEINTVANKVQHIVEHNYDYQFSFVLPQEDWIETYYQPLENNLKKLEQKYPDVSDALEVVRLFREEIRLYHDHLSDYSYVFYGMTKR